MQTYLEKPELILLLFNVIIISSSIVMTGLYIE
jgi:hypothetical protein